MNNVESLNIDEFFLLLKAAQSSHLSAKEPIPQIGSDTSKLESCLNTPFQTFLFFDLYPGLFKKAAVLFYLLIKNHPLQNGNKRMACLCLAYFMLKNNYHFFIPQQKYYQLSKKVAMSKDKDKALAYIEKTIERFAQEME